MSVKRVSIIKDDVSKVVASITQLVSKQVLVGIPDSTATRSESDEEDKGPINNATLGYIHEYGSPEANIPARPFLIPGVKKAEDKAVAKLKQAAQATMRGDSHKADQLLNDAGIIGMSAAKAEIQYGNFQPLSPATIRARRRGRQTASMRPAEKKYLELIAGGMSAADAESAAGIRPLINTGALRDAITYVVRKK